MKTENRKRKRKKRRRKRRKRSRKRKKMRKKMKTRRKRYEKGKIYSLKIFTPRSFLLTLFYLLHCIVAWDVLLY